MYTRLPTCWLDGLRQRAAHDGQSLLSLLAFAGLAPASLFDAEPGEEEQVSQGQHARLAAAEGRVPSASTHLRAALVLAAQCRVASEVARRVSERLQRRVTAPRPRNH